MNAVVSIEFSEIRAFESHLVEENLSLSLFQKVLLITDGTVTDLLSLYTGEKIRIKKIGQEIGAPGPWELLQCAANTPLLRRTILLSGQANNYIYAESFFVFDRLSRSIQHKLLETDQPIGLMWKEEKLEASREVLGFKLEYDAKDIMPYFGEDISTPLLSRSYLIHNQKTVLGIITEKFPLTYFRKDL